MDKFHRMSVYIAVAEAESFAGGARKLGMSPPAVTRAVAALEDELGVKLLNRTTRHVRATDAGQRYLDDARRILAEVQEADEMAAGVNGEPRGHLTVTAPVLFGQYFVMPGIVDFMQRYPGVEISALFVDRIVNLLDEGVDVGIRIGDLPDSTLRAIRVGQVRKVLCAAPAYLAQYGTPASPDELLSHQITATTAIGPAIDWKFGGAGNKTVRIKPRLTVTSNDGAIAAVVRGAGIARVLSYQIARQLAAGEVQIILPEYEPELVPIHVVHREGRNGSAKVRSFVDFIVPALREALTLP